MLLVCLGSSSGHSLGCSFLLLCFLTVLWMNSCVFFTIGKKSATVLWMNSCFFHNCKKICNDPGTLEIVSGHQIVFRKNLSEKLPRHFRLLRPDPQDVGQKIEINGIEQNSKEWPRELKSSTRPKLQCHKKLK